MASQFLPRERTLFLYNLAKRGTELYNRDSIGAFYDELEPEEFVLIVEELLNLEEIIDEKGKFD